MMRTQQQHNQDYNRLFADLSSLILGLLRSSEFSSEDISPARGCRLPAEMTPGGFAALLMGVSVSLMFCGSVTFFIGFMLMPWVVGFVVVFYFVGVLSSLSMIGRAILCCFATSLDSSRKESSGWKIFCEALSSGDHDKV